MPNARVSATHCVHKTKEKVVFIAHSSLRVFYEQRRVRNVLLHDTRHCDSCIKLFLLSTSEFSASLSLLSLSFLHFVFNKSSARRAECIAHCSNIVFIISFPVNIAFIRRHFTLRVQRNQISVIIEITFSRARLRFFSRCCWRRLQLVNARQSERTNERTLTKRNNNRVAFNLCGDPSVQSNRRFLGTKHNFEILRFDCCCASSADQVVVVKAQTK